MARVKQQQHEVVLELNPQDQEALSVRDLSLEHLAEWGQVACRDRCELDGRVDPGQSARPQDINCGMTVKADHEPGETLAFRCRQANCYMPDAVEAGAKMVIQRINRIVGCYEDLRRA